MRKSTVFSFVALASGMDPFAREQLRFMRELTILLSSLTVVRHKVLAKIVLQVMSQLLLLINGLLHNFVVLF